MSRGFQTEDGVRAVNNRGVKTVDQLPAKRRIQMSTEDIRTETREVSGFDQVALAGFGELNITQGEVESLAIEAPQEILDRIETEVSDGKLTIRFRQSWTDWVNVTLSAGLSGLRVTYDLRVKRLTDLVIMGAARVRAANLKTDRLSLELRGVGDVSIASLNAERLQVNLPGAGKISVAGRVTEQKVTIRGAGNYEAPELESQTVEATLEGVGSATVWAVKELDVTLRGIGEVSYYGTPQVRKNIEGPSLGGVKSLGSR
jgi:hypothetical protein